MEIAEAEERLAVQGFAGPVRQERPATHGDALHSLGLSHRVQRRSPRSLARQRDPRSIVSTRTV
jgi:hypothetical protein